MHVTLKEPHHKLGLDLATSAANLLGKWGKWGKSHLRTTAPPLASGTRLFGKWEFPTLSQTFLPSQHGELTGLNHQSGDSEPVIQNRWFITVDSEWSVK